MSAHEARRLADPHAAGHRTIGSIAMTDDTRNLPSPPPSPWDRFGWLMGGIWLLFLAFPLAAVLTSSLTAGVKAAAIALLAAFAAVYVYGFVRLNRAGWGSTARWSFLTALVLLTFAFSLFSGIDALSLVPYVVAFVMFTQPVPRAFWLTGAILVLTTLILLVTDMLTARPVFLLIPIMVALVTGLIRWIDDRQDRHLGLERELNLVAERERVARDVHDVLGHSLTVITVKSELAERLVDADPDAAKAELAQIRSMTREALAEIRATVAGLRVARLADELASARTALADAGIAAEVPTEVDVVDPRHRLVLAWVLREAVTNVVRHAQASRCTVELGSDSLVVTDDGVGPPPALTSAGRGLLSSRAGGGTGLRGVAERVQGAGGTLSVSAVEGGGTRLEVRW